MAKWAELSPVIERLAERTAQQNEFKVAAGSSMAGDDKASSPYQVSHAVHMCLTAGVDHLHAIKCLIVDGGVLHIAAPYSLGRAALETISTAFWILHPASRNDRVTRALRWYSKNNADRHDAEGSDQAARAASRAKLYVVGDRRGLPRDVVGGGYTSTAAVQYADTHSSVEVLLLWRICSGFAHGRPWAYLNLSDREQFPTEDPGVHHIKMTASTASTILPALSAVDLLREVLKLHGGRAGDILSTI